MTSTLCRTIGSLLSPAGSRGALSVVMFHRVLAEQDALFPEIPDGAQFERILRWLAGSFTVLPLDEAVEALRARRLPQRALAISFDDGYADNVSVALPILQRCRMNATFFVSSAFLNGGRMWNDTVIESIRMMRGEELDLSAIGLPAMNIRDASSKRNAIERILAKIKYLPLPDRERLAETIGGQAPGVLPTNLMMTSGAVRQLRQAGMLIGGHTRSHPILRRLPADLARQEIEEGKADLERLIGEPIDLFAYPNGRPSTDYDQSHAAMVKSAGFRAALTTSPGVARSGCDLMQLPRFTPWDRTELRFCLRLIGNMRHGGRVAA